MAKSVRYSAAFQLLPFLTVGPRISNGRNRHSRWYRKIPNVSAAFDIVWLLWFEGSAMFGTFPTVGSYRSYLQFQVLGSSHLWIGLLSPSRSWAAPEMFAFGRFLVTAALWHGARSAPHTEPDCDEPVSATSSALLQRGNSGVSRGRLQRMEKFGDLGSSKCSLWWKIESLSSIGGFSSR